MSQSEMIVLTDAVLITAIVQRGLAEPLDRRPSHDPNHPAPRPV